ncbi:hypothetical protein ACF0H5_021600 [Mactra antiquata]
MGSNEKILPPLPITAEDAAFRLPPPSYEEIMGVYQTSVKENIDDSPPPSLAYIDIMPRCLNPGNIAGKCPPQFDDFSAIVEGANRWLIDNPLFSVWKCESVDRKLSLARDGSLSYDLNEMLRHEATFGFTVYIKGLRLWLTRRPNPGTPQQLGIKHIVPDKVTIELPTRGYYRRGRMIVNGNVTMLGGMHTYQTFEGLSETMKKLNSRLAADPLPGSILTIETDSIKAYEGLKKDLDPESTSWSEDKDKYQRNTQVIRIFYVKGQPAKEEIGYEEIVPHVIQMPTSTVPGKFEPFDNVVGSVGQWVANNQGVRIVNIQQFDAVVHKNIFAQTMEVASDSTDERLSTYSERRMATTLRIFHVKSNNIAHRANFVSCRLFLPARIGRRQFESMTQTMERIDAWLRVTGLPIYSVETVKFLLNENNPHGADFSKSDYIIRATMGKYWLTGVRVYFNTPYSEPDPGLLPPVPDYSNSGSGSCTIL